MADVIMGVAQLANWLPTTFAPASYGYFLHERTLSNYMTDYSFLLQGAKAVSIPQSALVVAESRGANAETPVEYTGNTETAGTLTVNQFYTAAHLITNVAQLQTSTQLQNHYIQATAYALLSQFETYMAGTILQGATTNDVTLAADNDVTWAKYKAGMAALLVDNAYKPGQMALGMSPEAWALSTDDWGNKYVSAADVGGSTILSTGVIGSLAGTPIYISDDWDGDGGTGDETATLWNRMAVGYGLQDAFSIIGPVPDPTRGGIGFSVELYFGGLRVLEPGICNFNNP